VRRSCPLAGNVGLVEGSERVIVEEAGKRFSCSANQDAQKQTKGKKRHQKVFGAWGFREGPMAHGEDWTWGKKAEEIKRSFS